MSAYDQRRRHERSRSPSRTHSRSRSPSTFDFAPTQENATPWLCDPPLELRSNFYCARCKMTTHNTDVCDQEKCMRCNRFGHTRESCPMPECCHCATVGHSLRQCKRLVCARCGHTGHYAGECVTPRESFYCTHCRCQKRHSVAECRVKERATTK